MNRAKKLLKSETFNEEKEVKPKLQTYRIIALVLAVFSFICYILYRQLDAQVFGIIATVGVLVFWLDCYLWAFKGFVSEHGKKTGLLIWHEKYPTGWGASFNPYTVVGKICWLLMAFPFFKILVDFIY
ncbi:hypothetical protein [Enterococcus cecorum]|uniref:Uncharacterized protein n=1 Tax=Enterococcus cecorum TaxID=44008 RepID=A0A7X9NM11_9ENTE|nr:hypothetical protein [Enterococcus cecorum]NME49836.1 hypothetical protein [Enterococcus cecorum]